MGVAVSIETGIANILNGLGGLRVSEGWPDTINPDAAIIEGPTTIDEADIAGCKTNQGYEITLLFSLGGGVSRARSRLMRYLTKGDPKEIRASLYADPTLGGNAEAFLWRGIQQTPGRMAITGKGLQAEIAVDEYYGAVLLLEVVG